MNTVLLQEVTRYNVLIAVIHASLKDILKANKGLMLMSEALEAAYNSLFDGKVPAMWMANSYPSLKPLGSYCNDLIERLQTFQKWIDHGIPTTFWFSGMFFVQAFTTGVSQNYARKHNIPIDLLGFDFEYPRNQHPQTRPDDGAYTKGLFTEGAKWDDHEQVIAESDPKILFTPMMLIKIIPAKSDELKQYTSYMCPCYKVSTRQGTLSTTGHSTNFVMFFKVPIDGSQNNEQGDHEHWTKRGVAFLTQLDT
jgi:dynein heavy chain